MRHCSFSLPSRPGLCGRPPVGLGRMVSFGFQVAHGIGRHTSNAFKIFCETISIGSVDQVEELTEECKLLPSAIALPQLYDRRTLSQKFLDLVGIEVAHRNMSLSGARRLDSLRRASAFAFASPSIAGRRRYSLLSPTVLSGGVRA